MLSLLHIENIALIESADIQFDAGFNVLTGETGAGKTIVVDSIGAVIGERTSRDLIRTGASSAAVCAVFTDVPELDWFQENGAAREEDGSVTLQRELHPDGKNLCRVNGRPVTVSQLRDLGRQMLNIHGQHEGQQLLDENCHIDYLDSFGALEEPLSAFREAYRRVAGIRRQMESLRMDEAEKQRRMDTLTYQIRELERADLKAGEEDALQERRTLLRNAGKLSDAVEQAWYALSGGENSDGALALLGEAEGALRSVSHVSGTLADLASRAAETRSAAEDLSELVWDMRDQFDFSPGELDEVESRLDVLYRLKRKYGNSEEEMLDFLERCRRELAEIQDSDDTLIRLEQQFQQALEEARALGAALSGARREAAERLRGRIQTELEQLDMPKVRFAVEFSPKQGDLGMDETGMDQVQFLMSANVGESLRPIQKVASGGELARIMLAMKNVLAENDNISTMVFDEVDTGVSGRAAQKVAQKMASVARHKQVLCVTHLPQIAAMADCHLSVEKGESGGRTYTHVKRLDEDGRKQELARLTGGDHITETTLRAAQEQLDAARAYKSGGTA